MVLSSADFFFKISFLLLFFFLFFFCNISRVSISLDPDHVNRSKLFAKVIFVNSQSQIQAKMLGIIWIHTN